MRNLNRRTFIARGLGFAAAAGAGAAALGLGARPARAAGEPVVLKLAHPDTPIHPSQAIATRIAQLVEQRTGGSVKIRVFAGGQLGSEVNIVSGLTTGIVDLAMHTTGFLESFFPRIQAIDLPFLFKDEETYAKAMKGPIGKWLFQKLESRGISGLAYWDNGFHMTSANRPLLMPADFQGLKVRISGSKIADRYFRDVGSIPQIMAFSEVYQALQTGVVDGCENTASNYLTQKFFEVQKDITVSYHAHLQYAVIVNSKFWNGLPADVRSQLEKAMDEATDYTNSIAVQENEDALAEIKKTGKTTLHYLTDDQKKAWQEAMRPTYAWAKGRVGQEVLDLIAKELDVKMN